MKVKSNKHSTKRVTSKPTQSILEENIHLRLHTREKEEIKFLCEYHKMTMSSVIRYILSQEYTRIKICINQENEKEKEKEKNKNKETL